MRGFGQALPNGTRIEHMMVMSHVGLNFLRVGLPKSSVNVNSDPGTPSDIP